MLLLCCVLCVVCCVCVIFVNFVTSFVCTKKQYIFAGEYVSFT